MKKTINKMILVLGSLMLFLFVSQTSHATCTVKSQLDFNETGTLRRILGWYNSGLLNDNGEPYCRDGITFEKDTVQAIQIFDPVALTGGNNSNSEFLFGGENKVSLTFDANSTFSEYVSDGGEQLGKCAFYIGGTKNVRIKNITLKGGNSVGVHGLCIDSSSVVLDNVIIDGFDGDGILLSSKASNVAFNGIVVVGPNVKRGIDVLGDYSAMQTRIKFPFDEEVKTESPTAGLDLLGAQENMIVLPGTAQIKPDSLCTTYDDTSKTYTVQGFTACENCTEAQQIKRLYLFEIPSLSSLDQQSVGQKVLAAPIQVVEGGTSGYVGFFSIPYTPKDVDKPGRLFVLPEVSPALFASTSKTIELNFKTTCTGENAGGSTTNTTGAGTVGKSSKLGGTLQQCLTLGAMGVDPS